MGAQGTTQSPHANLDLGVQLQGTQGRAWGCHLGVQLQCLRGTGGAAWACSWRAHRGELREQIETCANVQAGLERSNVHHKELIQR